MNTSEYSELVMLNAIRLYRDGDEKLSWFYLLVWARG